MNKKATVALVTLAIVIAAGSIVWFLSDNKNGSNTKEQSSQQTKKTLKGDELIQATFDKLKTQVPTVTLARVFTESTDPNNLIGKAGQYQYGGAYYDTRTKYIPTVDDNGNSVAIESDNYGTSAGGQIEIYANSQDAEARGEYLKEFQTGPIQVGAYRVEGITVFRVSENYTASQQVEMLDLMQKDYNELK